MRPAASAPTPPRRWRAASSRSCSTSRRAGSCRAEGRPTSGGLALMQATTTPVQDFREASGRVLRIDPLMLLATIGLIAASIYIVANATQDDIPGDPNYYAYRQGAYAGVGFVLMLLMTRF